MHALVPGGGQFWNGPEHTGKGIVVAAGTGVAVVTAGVLFGAATMSILGQKDWDSGAANYIANACDIDPTRCKDEQKQLATTGSALQLGGGIALGVGALFWGAGIVDAVVAAE
jgi:hypothetical protein